MLRRNVRALYEDARSHILIERSASQTLAQLQSKVTELQKAFRQLSEVAIAELEGLRADVERQAEELSAVQRFDTRLRALEQQTERIAHRQQIQRDEAAELSRLLRAELEREKREARVESDLRDLREAAEYDRASLQNAIRALNAATAAVEERQAHGEDAIRATRDSAAALSARQEVLSDEVGILADAMHEATLGGGGILLPRAPRRSAWAPRSFYAEDADGAGQREARCAPTSAAAAAADDDRAPIGGSQHPFDDGVPARAAGPAHRMTALAPGAADASLATAGLAASLVGRRSVDSEHEHQQPLRGVEAHSIPRREGPTQRLDEAQRHLNSYDEALAQARASGRQR